MYYSWEALRIYGCGNLRSEVKGIENYSRKELTKKMSKIIKEIEV